jgi:hypothetical protein
MLQRCRICAVVVANHGFEERSPYPYRPTLFGTKQVLGAALALHLPCGAVLSALVRTHRKMV